ncbi:MAG: recombinase family protein [Herbaspirillum sp.]
MQKAAIYARVSSDEKKVVSIEDQIRRSLEYAKNLGLTVLDNHIFFDSAITGTAKGRAKRTSYDRLLRAWENKEFDALIVDEVSRLARDPVELARIQVRIEKSKIRLISTDGLDSSKTGWQLQYGFSGVIASHFVRETAHRVVRGMQGQLERGFMIAYPPLGYEGFRATEEGTKWIINEVRADRVRMIYEMRRKGASLMSIAKKLNDDGVPTPRKPRKSPISYWRPATVKQLLRNTIYRGLFVWNGSDSSKAKQRRGEATSEPKDYPRPELRIIDDDTWFACNQGKSGWRVRGGDKHVFAGLLSCGVCQSRLTVSSGGSVPSLHCAQCAQARRVGVEGRSGRYISANGVKAALIYVLKQVFSAEAKEAFRKKLRARLEGGQEERITVLKQDISQKAKQMKYLLRALSSSDMTDVVVEEEYTATLEEKRKLDAELSQAEAILKNTNVADIERQLKADPLDLLPHLFGNAVPAEKTRAALRRLFPVIATMEKLGKFSSHLVIEFAPGVALAECSKTAVIDAEPVELHLKVTGGAKRPTVWVVEELT